MRWVRLRFIIDLFLVVLFIRAFNVMGESIVKNGYPGEKPQAELKESPGFQGARIAKWYNNCAAAISITYDDGDPTTASNRRLNRFVSGNGLTMDYEIVTRNFVLNPHLKEFLLKKMIPLGLGYFGHGHRHINHDNISYKEALRSFERCYRTLKDFGLKPVAYAYPYGADKKPETKRALADAGFLCGRLHFSKWMTAPYIVPGSQLEPEDWFALPTLVMEDYGPGQSKKCVSNNEELIPYLDETLRRSAWIILTYHTVGEDNQDGFFKRKEFEKNIYSIKERNFWNASMNAVTLYIRERLHARVKIVPVLDPGKEIKEILVTVADGLPNDIYDQPLTVLVEFPKSWIDKPVALVEKEKVLNTFVLTSVNGMISLRPDEIERKIVKLVVNNEE